jgi:[ribosomal protein S18]-alanine N-acetyltransferase
LSHYKENPAAVLVREARQEDIAAMMELERQAGTAAHWREEDYARIFERVDVEGLDSQDRAVGLRRLALVVEDGATVLGFLVARWLGREWEIENVVISAEARRRGMGGQLVDELKIVAREHRADAISLEVRASNQAARSLYERCGFEEVGRRKDYYANPEEDALVYKVKLSGEHGRERTAAP